MSLSCSRIIPSFFLLHHNRSNFVHPVASKTLPAASTPLVNSKYGPRRTDEQCWCIVQRSRQCWFQHQPPQCCPTAWTPHALLPWGTPQPGALCWPTWRSSRDAVLRTPTVLCTPSRVCLCIPPDSTRILSRILCLHPIECVGDFVIAVTPSTIVVLQHARGGELG